MKIDSSQVWNGSRSKRIGGSAVSVAILHTASPAFLEATYVDLRLDGKDPRRASTRDPESFTDVIGWDFREPRVVAVVPEATSRPPEEMKLKERQVLQPVRAGVGPPQAASV